MTRSCACAFIALAILGVPASLSAAADPPRKKITLTGRGYPGPVTVTFAAPVGYTSGFGGLWKGPRWRGGSGSEGDAGLTVSVGGEPSARSAEQAARKRLGSNDATWTVVASGPIAVPHLVRGRKVGSVQGFFLILHNLGKSHEGWHKAAVGVPLGKGNVILAANFSATTPSDDATQTIEGKTPSVWNRQAIEQALRGMAVEWQLAVQPAVPSLTRCFGMARTVSGKTGTAGADVIIGGSGNDTLRGGGGNDRICGGGGDDTIIGGSGVDQLDGGDGDDLLEGGSARDLLEGGSGNDSLKGGSDDDQLRGASGDDNLEGGSGIDKLFGGPGNDRLRGGDGGDRLYGGQGTDDCGSEPIVQECE